MDPGQLTLGELPGGCHRPLERRRQVGLTGEVRPELAVTHRTQRRRLGFQTRSRSQASNFLEEALLHHLTEALLDTLVQPGSICRHQREA